MYKFLLTADTFKALNIPQPPEDLKELDRKIQKGEHVDPILTWKGFILTGYEQDHLGLKHHKNIPVKEVYFPRKNDAIIWLCRHQLNRADLCWNAKAWLISRLYEALRESDQMQKAKETFQYRQFSPATCATSYQAPPRESGIIMKKIGSEYNFHKETVKRYIDFGRNLDRLEENNPGIRNRILTGEFTVKMSHMPALINMPAEKLTELISKSDDKRLIPPPEYDTEAPKRKRGRKKKDHIRIETGIKQMPEYDPDAALNGLVFTIGAWKKAISRTAEQTDLSRATEAGKENLQQALNKLIQEAEHLCRMLEE